MSLLYLLKSRDVLSSAAVTSSRLGCGASTVRVNRTQRTHKRNLQIDVDRRLAGFLPGLNLVLVLAHFLQIGRVTVWRVFFCHVLFWIITQSPQITNYRTTIFLDIFFTETHNFLVLADLLFLMVTAILVPCSYRIPLYLCQLAHSAIINSQGKIFQGNSKCFSQKEYILARILYYINYDDKYQYIQGLCIIIKQRNMANWCDDHGDLSNSELLGLSLIHI